MKFIHCFYMFPSNPSLLISSKSQERVQFPMISGGRQMLIKGSAEAPVQSCYVKKVLSEISQSCRPEALWKKRLWYIPVNFVKFPRAPFLQNTSGGCFFIWFENTENFWWLALVKTGKFSDVIWSVTFAKLRNFRYQRNF